MVVILLVLYSLKPLNRFLQIVKILWFIERLIHSDAKYAIAVLKVLRTIMLLILIKMVTLSILKLSYYNLYPNRLLIPEFSHPLSIQPFV